MKSGEIIILGSAIILILILVSVCVCMCGDLANKQDKLRERIIVLETKLECKNG